MKYTTKSLKISSAAPAKRLNQYLKPSQAKPLTKQSLLISAHG